MSQSIIEANRRIYNASQWGEGYVGVNQNGRVVVYPHRDPGRQCVDLFELAQLAQAQGLRLPILFRFGDIIRDRVSTLCGAFSSAMKNHEYTASFTAVYPIKVNQQRMVVEDILDSGSNQSGLEAGSKPELMIVLALSRPGGIIVCNGYKDRKYIRLALIGQSLGYQVYIVIEKLSEIPLILEEAAALGVEPMLGVRVRLSCISPGKWQDTGGEKSKFGLSAAQLLRAVEYLLAAGKMHWLELLHFHLGSQVANIQDIQRGLSEAVRALVELSKLGVNIKIIDVGGGLGVDYEGTHSRSECSINYSIEQYANTVVHSLAESCAEHGISPPNIVTESGRAITAHHALIVTNIIDSETSTLDAPEEPGGNDPVILSDLWECLLNTGSHPAREIYQDALHWISEVQTMYTHGVLDLEQRARAEHIYSAVCKKISAQLQPDSSADREILDELNEKLADKYFCNLSIFQSLPDIWAIDQVFPIMPLHRLDEPPDRRVILQDLTCDSDGRIKHYVDSDRIESTLPLHGLRENEDYLIGIFMVGAYQETLGDMHNLFGNTDSVNVEIDKHGNVQFSLPESGDTADELLQYVHYDRDKLLARYRDRATQAGLSETQRQQYLAELEDGLAGYTYLEK
ncbi:MAG: biosynthetic arginine decarboxylase [Gammaproteobacteria bacterium]